MVPSERKKLLLAGPGMKKLGLEINAMTLDYTKLFRDPTADQPTYLPTDRPLLLMYEKKIGI